MINAGQPVSFCLVMPEGSDRRTGLGHTLKHCNSLSHRNHVHVALTWGFTIRRRSVSARKPAEKASEINLVWHVAKAGFGPMRQPCCGVGQAGESARIGGRWAAVGQEDVMEKVQAAGGAPWQQGQLPGSGLLLGLVAARLQRGCCGRQHSGRWGCSARRAQARSRSGWMSCRRR